MTARVKGMLLLLAVCTTIDAVNPALRAPSKAKAECPADILHELITKCPKLMENPMLKSMMKQMEPVNVVGMINSYLQERKKRLTVISYLQTYCADEIPEFCSMCRISDCPQATQSPTARQDRKDQLEADLSKLPKAVNARTPGISCADAAKSKNGDTLSMDYTGWLYDPSTKKQGKQFDSSVGKQPFQFELGAGSVIKGWDQGLSGLCAGDKKTLIIPPELGYGDSGAGGVIPGGATLKFDVTLLKISASAPTFQD